MNRAVLSAAAFWRAVRRRPTLASMALSAALCLAVLVLPLLLGQVYFGLDLSHLDLATDCALRRGLGDGGSLWLSPYLGNGGPLLTRPSVQALYPPRWILMGLFDSELAVSLAAILHLALAAAGTTLLARSFHLRFESSVLAGLALAFSGTALNLLLHTNSYMVGAALLPWAWVGARWALRLRYAKRGLLLGWVALLGMLLGGEPQSFGIAALLVAGEILRDLLRSRRRGLARPLALLAIIPLAFAAALPLWGGFLAEASLTRRALGLSPAEALEWSYGPSLWLSTLWPRPGGNLAGPSLDVWAALLGNPAQTHTWNPAPYLGPTFVVLLAVGATRRRARWLLLVAAAALLLALGSHGPLLSWIGDQFPSLLRLRHPLKLLLPLNLAAVLVVAMGVERLGRAGGRRLFAVVAALLLLFHGAAWWLLWVGTQPIAQLVNLDPLSWVPGLDGEPAARLRGVVLRAALPLLAACVVLALLRTRGRIAGWLLVFDLVLAVPGSVQTGPRLLDLVSPLQPLARQQDSRFEVLCVHNNLRYYQFHLPGLSTVWGGTALHRIYAVPELQACDGVVAPIPYSPVQTAANHALAKSFARGNLSAARALGCTLVLHEQRRETPGLQPVAFPEVAEQSRDLLARGPTLHRLRDPVPEAFVARQPQRIADHPSLLARIERSDGLAALLSLVDDPLGRLAGDRGLPTGAGTHIAALRWPQRHRVELELQGSGGAVVGVRTVYLRGWQARQAGRTLPVVRVGGQHLAALVDDVTLGPVQFEYRSPGFTASVLTAMFALAAVVGLLWSRSRRPPPRLPRSSTSANPNA